MTESERLKELLLKCDPIKDRDMDDDWGDGEIDDIVDSLLANGVIVPPCKVGDTLFVLSTCYDIVSFPGDGVICPYENVCHIEDCMNYNDVLRPFPMTVEYLGIGDHGIFNIFFEETSVEYLSTDFGKTVFLNRDEAEKALEAMK